MRIVLGAVAVLFLLGTSVPAHAGIFSWLHGGDKTQVRRTLPKPADYPRVRPKIDETHKCTGKRVGQHPKEK